MLRTTQREMEVLELALSGLYSPEIARKLGIVKQVVCNHLCHAYKQQPEMLHRVRRARMEATKRARKAASDAARMSQ